MVPPTRRNALRTGVGLLGGLAGCLSRSGPGAERGGAETTTRGPTSGSTTNTGPDPSIISPSASVVSQASSERPAIVELGLRNDGDVTVPVSPRGDGGLPLEYFPGTSDELVLYPTDPEHVHVFGGAGLPESSADGCWRFPDDGMLGVDNLAFEVRLAPGESYANRHRVYYDGPDGTCFSTGTVTVVETLQFAEQTSDGPSFEVSFALSFGDDGSVSIAADGPL